MGAAAVDFTTEQDEIINAGAELAKRLARSDSTDGKRDLADKLVDLRATFQDSKGRPDFKGASAQYRAAAKAVYERAGLSADERERLRWSVTHHLRLELRRRLTAEQLADYGLNVEDRNTTQRIRAAKDRKPATTAAEFVTRVRALRSHLDEMADTSGDGTVPLDGLTADTAAVIGDELSAALTAWRRTVEAAQLPTV